MGKTAYSSADLGALLFKSRHEPRKNQKRFLKDLGGEGTSAALDQALAAAAADKRAVAACERLEAERRQSIDWNNEARVAEMIAHLMIAMEDQGLTQQDVADRCGWKQPMVAAYLTGAREPGVSNLAKLADAVGCVWRLQPRPGFQPKGAA
jgi:ribosome-binding protein aMBF1 (putative translation factor)